MAMTYHEQVLAPGVTGGDGVALAADGEQLLRPEAIQLVRALERAFSQSFVVIDCTTGHRVRSAANGLPIDWYKRLASCEEIAQRGRPEILDEVSPLVLLAVPLPVAPSDGPMVAVCAFLTETIEHEAQIAAAAKEFGIDPRQTFRWAQGRSPGIRTRCKRSARPWQRSSAWCRRTLNSNGSWPICRPTF